MFDFATVGGVTLGAGGLMSACSYRRALDPVHGERPTSFMLFVRARLEGDIPVRSCHPSRRGIMMNACAARG